MVNTNPFPPLPILLLTALPVGNGYFVLPLNLLSRYKIRINSCSYHIYIGTHDLSDMYTYSILCTLDNINKQLAIAIVNCSYIWYNEYVPLATLIAGKLTERNLQSANTSIFNYIKAY